MSAVPKVSIVLPVYNQADHIEHIARSYFAALDNLKHSAEILFVVNASRDGSLERCRMLEREYESVRVLCNDQPGWGRAVRTGLAEARGEIVCYTNSARTDAYTLALHVMVAVTNPSLVIKANRRLRHPLMRRIGSVLYNVECRTLFDLPVWDVNGTPKVFGREVCRRLDLQENGDLIDLEFILRCKQLGVQILEVPIVSSVRHGGESTTNYYSALQMYWGAFRMSHSMKQRNSGRRGHGN
ncbi:MAG: glycosyltransferase family 2 protein [Desulfomonilaceae bacterium]|nr:glycosyltransferase family 2 protein [Desulfomonilaceae bacterium]